MKTRENKRCEGGGSGGKGGRERSGGLKMKYNLPPGRDVALLSSCRASTINENVP
jgi:hypothetical protein